MESGPFNPKALETPAVFVNHFQMTTLGGVVRLSFGELAPTHEPVFRSTILLAAEDAQLLAKVILTSLGGAGGRPS